MLKLLKYSFIVGCTAALAGCGSGDSGTRTTVSVTGSSTVYPFASAVAEVTAANNKGIKTPKVESIGSGAGIDQFCAGIGSATPDVANASRRMKKSEFEKCQTNGVKEIIEVQVGIDGIAFASAKGAAEIKLTPVDIYKAIAANPFGKPNTAKTWKDVNPALPAEPILVYGPPTTSGTRDALAELILTEGCKTDEATGALKETDKAKYKAICTEVREDGLYVDGGEQDNLIVKKIAENPKAIGIFGFSFLEANMDTLKGIIIGGVIPSYDNIVGGSYPGSRPLYIYVKKAHLPVIKGLKEFLGEWPKAWGADGLLKEKGMVVSPEDVRKTNADIVAGLTILTGEGLK
ncbi:MAG: substrate-binding domain-containing protein [Sphingorhabdus sp.]